MLFRKIPPKTMGDIKKIFNPETIALIGATEEEKTVGRTILENLLRPKNRKIFAVNPKTENHPRS